MRLLRTSEEIMKVEIKPSRAIGSVKVPSSKSMAHRLLICAALADGVSKISGISSCEDVSATLDCLKSLGIEYEECDGEITVFGKDISRVTPTSPLNCRESGSTLRFLIPVALLSGKTTLFYGEKSLFRRPMSVYEKLCAECGMTYINDGSSIAVKGPLDGGSFEVVGNISSQFISGLLFALPLCKRDSTVKIISAIESRSYIDMTIEALRSFGVTVSWSDEHTLFIKGNQRYTPKSLCVEGDWSGAAFPDALNLFGGSVTLLGLNPDTIQGDRVYKRYFDMLTAGVPSIHIGDCPDLGPILFAVAAAKCGGIFSGTKRLKIKESDRAAAMAEELSKFGATVAVHEDSVVVYPTDFHAPTETLYGHNDHRIVMALSVLLTVTGGEIEGAEAVSKSYPEFFSHLDSLGIEVISGDVSGMREKMKNSTSRRSLFDKPAK